eukprot:79676-Amphidinium_carterae.1
MATTQQDQSIDNQNAKTQANNRSTRPFRHPSSILRDVQTHESEDKNQNTTYKITATGCNCNSLTETSNGLSSKSEDSVGNSFR